MAEQELTVSDALQEVAKFKNLFRPIEKLETLLLVVQDIEGRKNRVMAELKEVLDQKVVASAGIVEITKTYEAKQQMLKDFTEDFDKKLAEAKSKFDADMSELSEQYSQVSVAARDKVAQEIKDEQAKLDEIVAKRGDVQRDVRLLEAEVDRLTKAKAEL